MPPRKEVQYGKVVVEVQKRWPERRVQRITIQTMMREQRAEVLFKDGTTEKLVVPGDGRE